MNLEVLLVALMGDCSPSEPVPTLAATQVTESMRRDIHAKNERIVSLENSLETQRTRYEAELQAVTQKLEENTGDHMLATQHMEANFQDQIESLTQKLKVCLFLVTLYL